MEELLKFYRVMKVIAAVVSFIPSHGHNHRQFQSLLAETDNNAHVLHITEVRQLSREAVLKRLSAYRLERQRWG